MFSVVVEPPMAARTILSIVCCLFGFCLLLFLPAFLLFLLCLSCLVFLFCLPSLPSLFSSGALVLDFRSVFVCASLLLDVTVVKFSDGPTHGPLLFF